MPQTIFITGISSGLGHGLAQHYLAEGHTVLGISRRTPDFQESSGELKFAEADLAEVTRPRKILRSFLQDIHSIDVVYLNAGVLGKIQDMKDSSLDDIRHVMTINCWANKIILDTLFEERIDIGQVVAISSGASVNGNRAWGSYALSKATLNMLIQLYARENEDTHFISLAPGLIDTAMQDHLCDEVDPEAFPSVQKLKKARGTPNMPMPLEAAKHITALLPRLKDLPSGSFVDIRKL